MTCSNGSTNTNNGIPVGIGYDSRNRARSLMELSSISIDSISATNYYGIPAVGGITYFSALNDVCANTPSNGQILVWSSTCWGVSTLPDQSALSALVTSIEASTINLSAYINANESNWASGGGSGSGDPSVLSEPFIVTGTPTNLTNASVFGNTPSITLSYGPSSVSASVQPSAIDHNSLANLTVGNPHTQYVEGSSLTTTLSNYTTVDTTTTISDSLSAHIASASVHFTSGSLNLEQYALEANLVSLSSYVSSNEVAWNSGGGGGNALSAEPYITVVATGTLSNERVLTSSPSLTWVYDGSVVSATVEPSAVDHGSLANLTEGNPHTQYGFASSLNTVSGDLSSHIASASVHFTEASLNLSQYALDSDLTFVSSYITSNEVSWNSVSSLSAAPYVTVLSTGDLGNERVITSSPTLTWAYTGSVVSATVQPSAIDHNLLLNLSSGDPHTQYALRGDLTVVESTVDVEAAKTITVSGDLDAHIASASVHFTEASLNLSQYALSSNLDTLSGTVNTNSNNIANLTNYIAPTIVAPGQFVMTNTTTLVASSAASVLGGYATTGSLESVETSTVNLSAYVSLVPYTINSEQGNPIRTVSSTSLSLLCSSTIPGGTLTTKSCRYVILGDILQNRGSAQNVELQVTLGGTSYLQSAGSFPNDVDRYGFKATIDLVRIADDSQIISVDFMAANAANSTAGVGNYTSKNKDGYAYNPNATEVESSDLTIAVNMRLVTSLISSSIRVFSANLQAIPN